MANFSLKLDVQDLLRKVKRLERRAPEVVQETMRKTVESIARRFVGDVSRNRLKGGPTPDRLGVRTGNLRRSLGLTVEGETLDKLVAYMGFGPPAHPWSGKADIYGPMHEFGGVITAKNTQYLAIPIADNLTGAGVARINSPRDLGMPVFIPWVGDTYLVFDGGQLMFKLQRSVTIPARLHFADDWRGFEGVVFAKLRTGLKAALGKLEKL